MSVSPLEPMRTNSRQASLPLLMPQWSRGQPEHLYEQSVAAEVHRHRRRLICNAARTLAVLYAVWFVMTRRDKRLSRQWGSTHLMKVLGACARLALGALGVHLSIRWDGLPEGACPTPAERLSTSDAAMFSIMPHGAYPLSMLALAVPRFRTEPRLMTWRLRLAGASVLYDIPVVRELLLLLGGREATESTMRGAFADGCSVAVNPGGIFEQVHTDHKQERVFVQARLGFLRIAMAAGKPVIPTYCFGENQLFHTYAFARPLQKWLLRKTRVGLPLFTGAWGLPFGAPLPTKTALVVGREVAVGPPNPSPTDEQVEEVFGRYVAEVRRLFDAHAHEHLPPDVVARGLTIERIGKGGVTVPVAVPPPAPLGAPSRL